MLELALLILTPMFALLLSIVELSMPIFKKSYVPKEKRRFSVRAFATALHIQTTYNGTVLRFINRCYPSGSAEQCHGAFSLGPRAWPRFTREVLLAGIARSPM